MADFLIKAGADIELGCSTPLMESAQEGRLELVKYLLAAGERPERDQTITQCRAAPLSLKWESRLFSLRIEIYDSPYSVLSVKNDIKLTKYSIVTR